MGLLGGRTRKSLCPQLSVMVSATVVGSADMHRQVSASPIFAMASLHVHLAVLISAKPRTPPAFPRVLGGGTCTCLQNGTGLSSRRNYILQPPGSCLAARSVECEALPQAENGNFMFQPPGSCLAARSVEAEALPQAENGLSLMSQQLYETQTPLPSPHQAK